MSAHPAQVALGAPIARYEPAAGLSLATMAAVCAALLVYVSGDFLIAQVLDIKRPLEVVLMVPLAIAAGHYWVSGLRRLLDPLMFFVLVKTVVEITMRGEWIWVLDDLGTILALTTIYCAPRASVLAGAKVVAGVAALFAVLAFIQFVWLWFEPDLDRYGLYVSPDNLIHTSVEHPIALLGMFTDESYRLFGHTVHRLHSFAREPSLTEVYFLLPATLALLIRSRISVMCALLALAFSTISLAGSIFLSLAFSALWLVMLRFVSIRGAFLYGLPAAMTMFLWGVTKFGLGPFFQFMTFISQFGDFLGKGQSLSDRAGGAVISMDTAFAFPLGGPVHPILPGPWLVNSAVEAGWLGVLFLLLFLAKLGTAVSTLNSQSSRWSAARLGILLLLGALSTTVAFNDYQMSNYAGLVLLGFILRLVQLRNQEADDEESGPQNTGEDMASRTHPAMGGQKA